MNTHTPETIRIICQNTGERIQVPAGLSLNELVARLGLNPSTPYIGALVNNKLYGMRARLHRNKTLCYIDLYSKQGQDAYARSLVFLLYHALRKTLPEGKLTVEFPLAAGLFCHVVDGKGQSISHEQMQQLKTCMQESIARDLPIKTHYEPIEEVEERMRKDGREDTAALLHDKNDFYTFFYSLEEVYDFYSGLLAPSTGALRVFDLCPYLDGFLLRLPDAEHPEQLREMHLEAKSFQIFQEYSQLSKRFDMTHLADMNVYSHTALMPNVIQVAEALHEKNIVRIADRISAKGSVRVVLIAGPSSSGKTTFSKRLSLQLASSGIMPKTLSLDNYFINRVHAPRDAQGDYDFESLYALDLDTFNHDLNALIRGERVETPVYNFTTGEREKQGVPLQLLDNEILVIEGIHGLNPELTQHIPEEYKYKIFVSAMTALAMDDHNWLMSSDVRLLRRIIRDCKFRSYPAEDTLLRWQSVRRGEAQWILPFCEQAEDMFNSALPFELSAIRQLAEPDLLNVRQTSPAYPEARRLLHLLQYIHPVRLDAIPSTSLLREFLGGSGFQY